MFQEPIFVDGFAGGGGASTGIAWALGREVDIALNHDPVAIAVHAANHPGTEHICQDIKAVWPLAATRMRPVAGAWFSPDCKEHSKAKGGPVKDRNIRQLPMEIIPWLEQTQPVVAYVENVEEMQWWGPLDERGHIIKERRGEEFRRWIRAIQRCGYRVKYWELRACDYGAPTSRKRLYIVMRRDGLPIVKPKPTHGKPGSAGVRRGRLLPYRTAAECIDWTLPCPSIFLSRAEARQWGVKRPLEENTLRRIAHGVMRYVVNAAQPFIVPITHTGSPTRVHDIAESPLRTITTANGGELAVVDAQLAAHVTKFHGTGVGSAMDSEMPTVTANGEPARPAGATPLGMVGATMVHIGNGEREGQDPRALDIGKPMGTAMAEGVKQYPVAATLIQTNHSYADKKGPRPHRGTLDIQGQAPAQTTSGGTAVIAAHLEKFNDDSRPKSASDPLDAVLAGSARHAVIETEIVPAGIVGVGGRRGQSAPIGPKATMPTTTTKGDAAAVTAFVSTFYSHGGTHSAENPLPTAMAASGKHAIVAAHVEQANTGMVGRSPRQPVSTIVGKGCTQRIVETTLLEEGSLPPEMMAKAEIVAAFLVKYFGTAKGQPVDEPFATVTTLPRYAVVTVTIDAVTYVLVDIGLRMLTPRELARAQGFPDDYVLDPVIPKLKRGKLVHEPLTKAQQIRMIGNSVCPHVARALVCANQPGLPEQVRAAA